MSAAKRNPEPAFELVYDSKTPKSLHAQIPGHECWKGHMRVATADELERLKDSRCKHCASRIERLAAQAGSRTKAVAA